MRKLALIASIAVSTFLADIGFAQMREFYSTMEVGFDRPGSDMDSFGLPGGAYPDLCASACRGKTGCVAWTFVEAGYQGQTPRCWLKFAVPPPTPNLCCTSGMMTSP